MDLMPAAATAFRFTRQYQQHYGKKGSTSSISWARVAAAAYAGRAAAASYTRAAAVACNQ
jgi:hypothetical protein